MTIGNDILVLAGGGEGSAHRRLYRQLLRSPASQKLFLQGADKQAVSGLEHDSTTTAAHARNRISRFDCNEQRRWHYKPVERRWRSAEMPGVLRERAPLDPTVSREGQILNTNTRRPAEHTQASELRSVATEIGKQVAGDHSRPGRCMRHAGPVQVPG